MVPTVIKKTVVLVVIFLLSPLLFCPISDIDLNNIPAALVILKKIEAEIRTITSSEEITASDAHDLACLALFGLRPESTKIQEEIDLIWSTLETKLIACPELLKSTAANLLSVITVAKQIIDARLCRLKHPSRTPAVAYPAKIISLQPVIIELCKHREGSTPLFLTHPRATAAAAARMLGVGTLDFSKLSHPTSPPTGSPAIAKRKPTPYHSPAPTTKASHSDTGAGRAGLYAPKQPPRRLSHTAEMEYVVFDYYLSIHGKDGKSQDFLLIQSDDDGNKEIYYPAFRGTKPATPDDFKYYPDEIRFAELNDKQFKQLLRMYLQEGITLENLTALTRTTHFPFFSDDLGPIIRQIKRDGYASTDFTVPRLYVPTPAASKPIPTRRTTGGITFCEGACTIKIKERTFFR